MGTAPLRALLDATYPQLAAAYGALSPSTPALDQTWAGYLLDVLEQTGWDYGLKRLDGALGVLLCRRTWGDLSEQHRALFALERSQDAWDKAATELALLAWLEGRGLLTAIGWPPPAAGTSDTPPFDGRILVAGTDLAFDVKSAKGAGFDLLKQWVDAAAAQWAAQLGLDPPECEVELAGTLTQLSVGRQRRAITDSLAGALGQCTQWPTEAISIPVPDAAAPTQTAGSVTVRVRQATTPLIQHRAVSGVAERGASWAQTLLSHVNGKASKTANDGSPFIVAYVSLIGDGWTDADWSVAQHAMQQADQIGPRDGGRWVALLLWTEDRATTPRHVFLRDQALRTHGLDAAALAQALDAAPIAPI